MVKMGVMIAATSLNEIIHIEYLEQDLVHIRNSVNVHVINHTIISICTRTPGCHSSVLPINALLNLPLMHCVAWIS